MTPLKYLRQLKTHHKHKWHVRYEIEAYGYGMNTMWWFYEHNKFVTYDDARSGFNSLGRFVSSLRCKTKKRASALIEQAFLDGAKQVTLVKCLTKRHDGYRIEKEFRYLRNKLHNKNAAKRERKKLSRALAAENLNFLDKSNG